MPESEYRELVERAVRGLKNCGQFRHQSGIDPHPLDCSLAGRVSWVFGMGMTRAIGLCREFGQDPNFNSEWNNPESQRTEQ